MYRVLATRMMKSEGEVFMNILLSDRHLRNPNFVGIKVAIYLGFLNIKYEKYYIQQPQAVTNKRRCLRKIFLLIDGE